jgi:cytochrome c oxidase subunit 2
MLQRLLGLPELASEHGHQIDQVIGMVHVLMFALFVVWGGLFVYMLFRFRKGRNPKADYQGVKSHLSSWGEVGVAVVEAILLIGFSIPLYSQRVDALPAEDEATVVRVIGEQFAWNIHYPGPDGEFGRTVPELVDAATNPIGLDRDDPAAADDVTTINQLHVPVNKPVLIYLSSKDVIHSFFIPEMRIKQDAIPGLQFPLWFEPTVTTAEMQEIKGKEGFTYEIGCAQLCGIGHYRMKGFTTVHTQEEYDAWMAEQQEYLSEDEGGDDFWS